MSRPLSINHVLHTGRTQSVPYLPRNTFSNLSASKSSHSTSRKRQSARDLLENVRKNSSTFSLENCNTLESFICVCFAIIHRDQSPSLRPRCQRETPMTSPIHAASSSSHLTRTQSSHPTTKRDAPSYHPSNRAFYGPSKDNELPE